MTTPCPPYDPKFAKNYGYDDERGDFRILMHDHVLYRFELVSKLGKGSFG
jgi:dual specificity tyrosine-phosphorylation-regulated kinase 2/3/4